MSHSDLSFLQKVNFSSMLIGQQLAAGPESFLSWRRAFYDELHSKLKDAPAGKILPMARIENLSKKEFLTRYYDKSQPVVFKEAAKNWPCCKKWSLDFFEKEYSNTDALMVEVEGLTGHTVNKKFDIMTIGDLIKDIRNDGDKYLRFSPIVNNYPALKSDVDFSWLESFVTPPAFGKAHYLFIGGKNSVTHLHSDQPCNLYVQISGRKKWTLMSMQDSALVYPQVTKTAYFKTEVDFRSPDFDRYPLLKKVNRYEVVLNPGDVLYVPPHFWHYIENLDDTISLAFRWSSLSAALKSSRLFTTLRILAQSPSVWKVSKYGKIDTNLIWAEANGTLKAVMDKLKNREKARSKLGSH